MLVCVCVCVLVCVYECRDCFWVAEARSISRVYIMGHSEEWHQVAKARVVSADQWTHGLEDIWSGSLHLTEQRVCIYSLHLH